METPATKTPELPAPSAPMEETKVDPTKVDKKNVEKRASARSFAKDMLEMVKLEFSYWNGSQKLAFWDEIKDSLHLFSKPKEEEKTKNGLKPMTDKEAREFGEQIQKYGKFEGEPISGIAKKYLDYMLKVKQEEVNELSRYLANEKVAEELRLELEEDKS